LFAEAGVATEAAIHWAYSAEVKFVE